MFVSFKVDDIFRKLNISTDTYTVHREMSGKEQDCEQKWQLSEMKKKKVSNMNKVFWSEIK